MGILECLGRLYTDPGYGAKEVGGPIATLGRERSDWPCRRLGIETGTLRRCRHLTSRGLCSPRCSFLGIALQRSDAAQLADYMCQCLAVNELHCVVMHASLAAYRVNWHDVLMMQVRRRLSLL